MTAAVITCRAAVDMRRRLRDVGRLRTSAGNVTLRGPRYWDIAAQGVVVMVPPLVVALLAGRYIIRGLTLGAVK